MDNLTLLQQELCLTDSEFDLYLTDKLSTEIEDDSEYDYIEEDFECVVLWYLNTTMKSLDLNSTRLLSTQTQY